MRLNPEAIIKQAIEQYGRRITLACGFNNAFEGMAMLDMAWRIDPGISVFMLDPGKLHAETHDLIAQVEEHYQIKVRKILPDPVAVQAMEEEYGQELYRESIALRKHCCDVRKVAQLSKEALEGCDAWMSAIRNGQLKTRSNVRLTEEDNPSPGITKINPLANWTRTEAEEYVRKHNVPFHPLFYRGYGSLACECCTRALELGEGWHDGKWSWEEKNLRGEYTGPRECGLHDRSPFKIIQEV